MLHLRGGEGPPPGASPTAALEHMHHAASSESAARVAQDLERLFERALELHSEGDVLSAERSYLQVLNQDPKHVAALCNYGSILSDFRRYVPLVLPSNALTRERRGQRVTVLWFRDGERALAVLSRAVAADPSDAPSLASLAGALNDHAHRPDLAQNLYLKALHLLSLLRPRCSRPCCGGGKERLRVLCVVCGGREPSSEAVLFNYAGLLRRHADDLPAARSLLHKALLLHPDSGPTQPAPRVLCA